MKLLFNLFDLFSLKKEPPKIKIKKPSRSPGLLIDRGHDRYIEPIDLSENAFYNWAIYNLPKRITLIKNIEIKEPSYFEKRYIIIKKMFDRFSGTCRDIIPHIKGKMYTKNEVHFLEYERPYIERLNWFQRQEIAVRKIQDNWLNLLNLGEPKKIVWTFDIYQFNWVVFLNNLFNTENYILKFQVLNMLFIPFIFCFFIGSGRYSFFKSRLSRKRIHFNMISHALIRPNIYSSGFKINVLSRFVFLSILLLNFWDNRLYWLFKKPSINAEWEYALKTGRIRDFYFYTFKLDFISSGWWQLAYKENFTRDLDPIILSFTYNRIVFPAAIAVAFGGFFGICNVQYRRWYKIRWRVAYVLGRWHTLEPKARWVYIIEQFIVSSLIVLWYWLSTGFVIFFHNFNPRVLFLDPKQGNTFDYREKVTRDKQYIEDLLEDQKLWPQVLEKFKKKRGPVRQYLLALNDLQYAHMKYTSAKNNNASKGELEQLYNLYKSAKSKHSIVRENMKCFSRIYLENTFFRNSINKFNNRDFLLDSDWSVESDILRRKINLFGKDLDKYRYRVASNDVYNNGLQTKWEAYLTSVVSHRLNAEYASKLAVEEGPKLVIENIPISKEKQIIAEEAARKEARRLQRLKEMEINKWGNRFQKVPGLSNMEALENEKYRKKQEEEQIFKGWNTLNFMRQLEPKAPDFFRNVRTETIEQIMAGNKSKIVEGAKTQYLLETLRHAGMHEDANELEADLANVEKHEAVQAQYDRNENKARGIFINKDDYFR